MSRGGGFGVGSLWVRSGCGVGQSPWANKTRTDNNLVAKNGRATDAGYGQKRAERHKGKCTPCECEPGYRRGNDHAGKGGFLHKRVLIFYKLWTAFQPKGGLTGEELERGSRRKDGRVAASRMRPHLRKGATGTSIDFETEEKGKQRAKGFDGCTERTKVGTRGGKRGIFSNPKRAKKVNRKIKIVNRILWIRIDNFED